MRLRLVPLIAYLLVQLLQFKLSLTMSIDLDSEVLQFGSLDLIPFLKLILGLDDLLFVFFLLLCEVA